MILILSMELDLSTRELVHWLDYHKASWSRINGEEFDESRKLFQIDLTTFYKENIFILNGKKTDMRSIKVIVDRRTHFFQEIEENLFYQNTKVSSKTLNIINGFLKTEFFHLYYHLLASYKGRWFDHPDQNSPNKLSVLSKASRIGIPIPETMITNRREELKKFVLMHKKIITKPISETFRVIVGESLFMLYTPILTITTVEQIETEYFYPSLFQQHIDKQYEIRTFYLDGDFYSMAIFSQLDSQTQSDFRNYNRKKWNRMVPFELPKRVKDQLTLLMTELGLQRGSLDLIKANDDRYYFLEVNPVGQYDMISQPCNYFLSEKIALKAIELGS